MDLLELEYVSPIETANLESIKAMAGTISPMITEDFQKNVLAYLMINDRRCRLLERELSAVKTTLAELSKSTPLDTLPASTCDFGPSTIGQDISKKHVYVEVLVDGQKYDYIVDTGTRLRLDAAMAPRFVATIVIEDRHSEDDIIRFTVSGLPKVTSKKRGDSEMTTLAFPKLTEQIIYKIVNKKFYADGKNDGNMFKAAEDRLKMVRQKIREVLNYKKKCHREKLSGDKNTMNLEITNDSGDNMEVLRTPVHSSPFRSTRKRASVDFHSPASGSPPRLFSVDETPKSRRFSRRVSTSTQKSNLFFKV